MVPSQGRSQDFGEGGAHRGAFTSRAAKIVVPEATPINNDVIIN